MIWIASRKSCVVSAETRLLESTTAFRPVMVAEVSLNEVSEGSFKTFSTHKSYVPLVLYMKKIVCMCILVFKFLVQYYRLDRVLIPGCQFS